MQGIGIVVYCTDRTFCWRGLPLTQDSEDRLYAGAGRVEGPHCPQKAIAVSFEHAPEIDPPKRLTIT